MTVFVRPATTNDANGVGALLTNLTDRHLHADCTSEGLRRLLTTMTPDAVRRRMSRRYPHWVAVKGETLVGVGALRLPNHLFHLFVADEFQRQSVGRQLLHAIVEHCRASTPDETALTVNASSFGVPAYRRMGFVEDGPPQLRRGVRAQPMRLSLR